MEHAEGEYAFLIGFYLCIVVLVVAFCDSLAFAVFQAEPEGALVLSAIDVDLAAVTLRQSVDEPPFIDMGVSTVGATGVPQDPPKSVEVLSILNNLAFVDEVLVLAYRHQF